jgi:peptidyl-tRNA hydrolase
MPVEEYVLRRFRSSEKKMIEDGILKAMNAVESIIAGGIEKAMNTCNRTAKKEIPQP